MKTLSNQTIQLLGALLIGLVVVGFIGSLAMLGKPIPDILDRIAYLVFGAFLGSTAVNGVRKMNGQK
jgi:hypothetical protein